MATSSERRAKRREKQIKKQQRKRKAAVYIIGLVVVLAAAVGLINLKNYITSGSDIHVTDDGYAHAARFSDCVVVNGVDVSSHQENINWEKVKSSGVDFAFVRAGVRDSNSGELGEDRNFASNIKDAHDAGLLTGAYFFSQATSTDEAVEEAEYFLDIVKGYDIDLPLMIDYEFYSSGRLYEKSKSGELYAASQYNDIAMAFCNRIEEAGYDSGIYANYNMFTNYMDASLIDDQARLWVAHYNTSTDFKPDYMFWQCSDQSECGGIPVAVDKDFMYIDPEEVYETPATGGSGGRSGSSSDAVSIGECSVEFGSDSCSIHMRRAEPDVTVTYNGSTLTEGTDYTCTPIKNIEAGTGYVIIRGIGSYKDWKAVPFTIE